MRSGRSWARLCSAQAWLMKGGAGAHFADTVRSPEVNPRSRNPPVPRPGFNGFEAPLGTWGRSMEAFSS